jgi:ComF family protein
MGLLSKLLFPPKCTSCLKLLDFETPDNMALCPDCENLWVSEQKETCGVCAKEIGLCSCVTDRMQKARCKGFYKLIYYIPAKRSQVQNRLIYSIKQSRDQRTVAFLAEHLLQSLELLLQENDLRREDVILTYIPRGTPAKLQYGTDQAKALARELARLSCVEMQPLLRRNRGRGKQQKKLRGDARYQNAKRSFAPIKEDPLFLKGKSVILIDDIVTTGASIAACARLLRKMGAKSIYALAVASDFFNREQSISVSESSKHNEIEKKSVNFEKKN